MVCNTWKAKRTIHCVRNISRKTTHDYARLSQSRLQIVAELIARLQLLILELKSRPLCSSLPSFFWGENPKTAMRQDLTDDHFIKYHRPVVQVLHLRKAVALQHR